MQRSRFTESWVGHTLQPYRAYAISGWWGIATQLCFGAVLLGQTNDGIQPITVQQPTFGVSIDSDGVLRNRVFAHMERPFVDQRRAAVREARHAHLVASDRRHVSLMKLESAILRQHSEGRPPTDIMLRLAGLQGIDFVFIYPERHDVVIVGPAGAWMQDGAGRWVGAESGHPTILLEDLLVALRTFQDRTGHLPWVGCSIDPTSQGLERFAAFRRTIPRRVPVAAREPVAREIALRSESNLGLANVNVFGIASDTHLARVLVEADYRMKLIGLGLEPPPVPMATFITQMRRAPKQMQRWWFTPNMHRLSATPDGLAIRFGAGGVTLSTEKFAAGPNGRLQRVPSQPSAASSRYASAFTKKYEQIARVSPVYWQLRSAIDLLVAAAWLNQVPAERHLNHPVLSRIDESVFSVHGYQVPRQAACVANAIWKGNVLVAPVGGGVSISVADVLADGVESKDIDVAAVRKDAKPTEQHWWWD